MPDSLWPHGLQPTRLLCSWDFPGKGTGVGCHFLLQGIFPTQGLNPGLLNCRQILYQLSYIREALFSVYIKLSVFEIFTHGLKNVFDNSKSMVNKIKQIYHIKAIKYSICSHIMLKKSCKKVNHVVTFSTPKYSNTDFLRYPHASYHITKVFIFQFKFSVSVTNNLFTIDNLSKCSKGLSYF